MGPDRDGDDGDDDEEKNGQKVLTHFFPELPPKVQYM